MALTDKNLRLDLGCGSFKKEGTIGIDIVQAPEVDYTLDLEKEKLPFPDNSVEYVYSSHFLEHIEHHTEVFQEITRVCKDGAKLEFWTPYVWTNAAFIFGHKFFFTEDVYLHICYWFSDLWEKSLGAKWVLEEITYVVNQEALVELYKQGISLDFALKHCHNIVVELGVFITVKHESSSLNASQEPLRTFCFERSLDRYPIKSCSSKGWVYKLQLAQAVLKEIGIVQFFNFIRKNRVKIRQKFQE